jgi:hypothetical protein
MNYLRISSKLNMTAVLFYVKNVISQEKAKCLSNLSLRSAANPAFWRTETGR